MATYVRSDIATAPPVASSLFTLIDTFPPSLQSVVDLNTTFTSLFFSLFPSLLTSGSTTLTDPALVLTDGSKLTLNGSFTVTLTNASLGFPVSTGLISISGSATGLIRKAGVDVIETITGVTVPFSTDPISVSYNALGGITLGTIVTHAPTLDQIISGNDTVIGGIQDDTLYGFAGADTINGNGGNDTIGLITGDTAAGETINGGSGTDKLLIGGTVDLSSVTLTSIEQLDFNNPFTTGANSATFLASELNGTALSTSLGVTGETGAADAIVFNMAAATTLSLAGLTFATWAPAAGDVIQINGDSDAETITGSSQKDVITSAGGNDNVDGGSGDDTIFAGTGSDTVNGGDGNDTLVGNDTSDLFLGVADTLNGGIGSDTIYAESADIINGGTGFDVLYQVNDNPMTIDLGATSIEYMQAGFGDDTINAATQTVGVEVYAGGGSDTVTGSNFDDFIFAGVGNDTVVGNDGADVILGDLGVDSLSGGNGNDRIYIDSSDSFFDGGAGFDAVYISGGSGMSIDMAATNFEWAGDFVGGNDTIDASGLSVAAEVYAGGGTDTVIGGTAGDFLWGGAGNDTISGGNGNDTLVGEVGADRLTGGAGFDVLYGSAGGGADGSVDTFVFTPGWGTDIVFDFTDGVDKLDMTALGTNFASLTIVNLGGHAHILLGGNLISVANAAGLIDASDFLF